MSDKKQYEILIYLLACTLQGSTPEEKRLEKIDLESLYYLAGEHSVGAMACAALEKTSVLEQGDPGSRKGERKGAGGAESGGHLAYASKWRELRQNALRRTILMDTEREKVQEALNQAGIWHMLLKGAVLADWYPIYGIREMADQDILYDSSRQKDVMDIMTGLGYAAKSVGKSHHDVYEKPPVYNFEMHNSLFGPGHDQIWVDYYRDIQKRLIPVRDCVFTMSLEDLYIHVTAHGYKHYLSAGTGLRTLTDQYVFLQRYEKQMDWTYISSELKTLGIEAYERVIRSLSKKIFSMNPEKVFSQEEETYLNYILNSGVYGTMEHYIRNQLKKMDMGEGQGIRRKLRYIRTRLFPGESYFHGIYPTFEKYAFLRPFFWIYRIGWLCLTGMDRAVYELKILKNYEEKD